MALKNLRRKALQALSSRWGRTGQGFASGDPEAIKSLLVVRPHNELGDFILTLPMLEALREGFPQAKITWIMGPKHLPLAEAGLAADELLVWRRSGYWGRPWDLASLWGRLRRERFDLALIPGNVSISVTATLLASWSKARQVLGRVEADTNAEKSLAPYLNKVVPPPQAGIHQVRKHFDFLPYLGLSPPRQEAPRIRLPAQHVERARALISEMGLERRSPLIFVHPGAGKPANRWPSVSAAKFCDLVDRELGGTTIFNLSPGDETQVRKAHALARGRKVLTPGLPLLSAAALARECDLFVGADTGLLHVASAGGAATLGLYGPTDPQEWAPLSPNHVSLRGEDRQVGMVFPEDAIARSRRILDRS